MPNEGRGQVQSLAQHLSVHTTLISHVFSGQKELSLEHSYGLCDYFGLTELEREYFMILVSHARAGTVNLKKFYEKKREELKKQSLTISKRLIERVTLKSEDQALFYSDWYYSATRLLSSVETYQNPTALSEKLKLSIEKINQILDFLLKTGLLIKDSGLYKLGPNRTHIDASSIFAGRHHKNWHLKSMEKFDNLSDDELVYTCPVLIEKKDIPKIKKLILEFLESTDKVFDASGSEELCCLNIDWVKI